MTTPDSRQYNIPPQALPPSEEGVPSQQVNTYESLVTGLAGEDLITFDALVRLVKRGHAELLEGYLLQRARTPDANTLELLTQMRTHHRDFVTINTRVAELACICATIRVDFSDLPHSLLPDGLRPPDIPGVLTETALERLAQDPTYDSLVRQARAQQGEGVPHGSSEWGGTRNFARELGFYTAGLIALWANGQPNSPPRKGSKSAERRRIKRYGAI